jgi:hypothetical protein
MELMGWSQAVGAAGFEPFRLAFEEFNASIDSIEKLQRMTSSAQIHVLTELGMDLRGLIQKIDQTSAVRNQIWAY